MTAEEVLLAEAVRLAAANRAAGAAPFGAIVARDGEQVAAGVNEVDALADPTAHAEVQAIRHAARLVGSPLLAGCTLLTSCEPCPLCVAATWASGIRRVVFAADRHVAAAAGFSGGDLAELFAAQRRSWPVELVHRPVDGAAAALG